MDRHDGVAGIVLAAEHLAHLEGRDALLGGCHLGDRFGERVRITLGRELEEDAGVVELGALAAPAVDGTAQLRALALDLLGAFVVVPEVGLPGQLVERGEAGLGAGDVKDAPEASPDASKGLRGDPSPRWASPSVPRSCRLPPVHR
jgi:hypothetical protein